MNHDICYRNNSTRKGKHKCDDIMFTNLNELKPKGWREHLDK